MKKIIGVVFVFILVIAIQVPQAKAQTNTEALLAQLKVLMVQVAQLQQQLADIRGEIRDIIRDDLREGMDNEDIRKIQEVLASDRSIYPEGLTTGYFGPLTQAALKRFQTKFDLDITGRIDDETKVALETLLKERVEQGRVPVGLLAAPGLLTKFERRLKLNCDSGHGRDTFCKKVKIKYKFDDADQAEDSEIDDGEEDSEIDGNEEDTD